jgi:hypothetical protein
MALPGHGKPKAAELVKQVTELRYVIKRLTKQRVGKDFSLCFTDRARVIPYTCNRTVSEVAVFAKKRQTPPNLYRVIRNPL